MNLSYPLVTIAALLLAACHERPEPRSGFAGLGQQASAFTQVQRGQPLQFPRDHGAHDGYRIEWWYVTANLTDTSNREWGVQWTLFRTALRPGADSAGWDSPNVWMGHAGLTSPFGHHYAETLARGGIGQAGVDAQPFRAWIDNWSLQGTAGSGLDNLQMQAEGDGFRYNLQLTAKGPLVLHGDQGYSEKSGQGQASWYYSQPFYEVAGQVQHAGQTYQVAGQAWLDREWSSQPLAGQQQGWDWFSLHLDGGAKLMVFQVRQSDGRHFRAGTLVSAQGKTTSLRGEQIVLTEQARTRQKDGRRLPTAWRVQVQEHGVDVHAEAIEPQAWMDTMFSYWEGPIRLEGKPGGRGYLEMTGY